MNIKQFAIDNARSEFAKPSGKTAQGQEQHTKGPWRARDDGLVFFPDRVGGFSLQKCPAPEANARRIVACVNALEGVSLETLAHVGREGSVMAALVWERNNLKHSNDALAARNIELVEALKYWLPDETWMGTHYSSADPACKAPWEAFYKASVLLAKLKP